MTVLRRTYAELEDALGNALTRIEELEGERDALADDVNTFQEERDGARAERDDMDKQVRKLEQAVEGVRDAVRGV